MDFVKFDPQTGQILFSGKCPDSMLKLQGPNIVVADVDSRTHYVDVQAMAVVAFPPRPGDGYYWNWSAKAWDFDLTAARAAAWARIKAARDSALNGPFTWSGHVFDGDTVSQQRIHGAVQIATLALQAGQAYSVDWTLADNTTVTLSAADMIAVWQAMGAQYQANFAKGQALRLQIDSATTQAALDAIVW